MKNYFNEKGVSIPKIIGIIAVVAIIAIALVFILGKGEKKEEGPTIIGEASTGALTWKVISVKDRGNKLLGSESYHPETVEDKVSSGRFIGVEVIVENRGEGLVSLISPFLIDDQGAQLRDISYEVKEWVPEDKAAFLLTDVRPNTPTSFIFFYEVRADASDFKLEVKERAGSSQLINLGM